MVTWSESGRERERKGSNVGQRRAAFVRGVANPLIDAAALRPISLITPLLQGARGGGTVCRADESDPNSEIIFSSPRGANHCASGFSLELIPFSEVERGPARSAR